jgi:hypothetical protein
VATKRKDRWFFVFGFEKSQMSNINDQALKFLKEQAKDLLSLSPPKLAMRVQNQTLEEICHDTR